MAKRKIQSRQIKTALNNRKFQLAALVFMGFVGIYTLASSRASTLTASAEVESGVLAGGATSKNDTTASKGTLVSFGASQNSPVLKSITWQAKQRSLWATAESMAAVSQGKLYVFGGIGETVHYTPAKHVMRYDPVANTWTQLADMPNGLTHSGVVPVGNTIWLIAGYPEGTPYGQIFSTKTVWKYDIPSNTFSRGPDLPVLCGTGGAGIVDGKIYFARGTDQNRKDAPEHFMLDPANEAAGWKQLAPVLNARNHVAYVGYNHKMYLIGGQHFQDSLADYQNQTDVYDPATNTWTQLANMVNGRSHITAATFLAEGNIYVLGGEPTTNQAQVYNISANEWKNTTVIPTARRTPAGGYLGNHQIILAGGDGGSGTHDEAWIGTLNY